MLDDGGFTGFVGWVTRVANRAQLTAWWGRDTLGSMQKGLLKFLYPSFFWLAWLWPTFFIAFAFSQEVLMTVSEKKITELSQIFGPIARQRLTAWRTMMTSPENLSLSDRKKLEVVNDFMNQTPFVSDLEQWGKEDYWALPVEFLSTNGGDGEDFAIAKYFTLRALGVPDEKLQITYVKETKVYKQAHMVLAYYENPDAEPLILDNFEKVLQPASARPDLVPVYSFNGTSLWQAKERQGRGQPDGSADSIPQWKDIKRRMKAAT